MMTGKLVIENWTRDFFCEDYTDEFELVPHEDSGNSFYFKHNDSDIAILNKEQLQELIKYLQMFV